MKKLSLVLLTVLVAVVLGACGKKGSSLKADYITTYPGHYDTLNYLYSSSASDSDLFANFVDGLVENDNYQRIVPSLAYKWEVNDDYTKFTFHLRPGVKWVDRDFKEVAEVTAQDWVDAAQYILTPSNNSQVTTLWEMFVKDAGNYYCGLQAQEDDSVDCGDTGTTDFSDVGVKATDTYTVEYTLKKSAPYFLTALTYNPFFPVYGEYLADQGSDFGYDGDHILYNGAYVMDQDQTNALEGMKANPKYWDAEHVYLKSVLFVYVPANAGNDWSRLKYENGELSAFRLTQNDQAGWDKYVAGANGDGSPENPANPAAYINEYTSKFTYFSEWNWGRENFDGSDLTERQHAVTILAMQNKNFRKGFLYGMDRTQWLRHYTPDDYTMWIRSSYMPAKLAVDVENNKDYVDYLGDQVWAHKDEMPAGMFDTREDVTNFLADAFNGVKSDEGDDKKGVDWRYQPEAAATYFETAKQELLALGEQTVKVGDKNIPVTIQESDFPIHVESVGSNSNVMAPFYTNTTDTFNAEKWGADGTDKIVSWDLLVPNNDDEWSLWASQQLSYDLRWFMGWGPDYADPMTYLHTFVENGDMLDYSSLVGKTDLQSTVLGNYTGMVNTADAKVDIAERYTSFAEAEYSLVFDEALVIPFFSQSGEDIYVSNVKPHTAMKAPYGLSESKYKYMVVLDEPVTRAQREVLDQAFEFNRPGNDQ
jgi:oligopeptide transport system substrate-binding protein